MEKETERMKIQIVAGIITTAWTNMSVILLTMFVTVFVSLFTAFLTTQISLLEFFGPTLIIEILVVYGLWGQRQRLIRRTKHLDKMIGKIESSPPTAIGTLTEILEDLRKL